VPDPGRTEADERLVKWAQAIADREILDWERLRSSAPELGASIEALRLVEHVMAGHGPPEGAPPAPAGPNPGVTASRQAPSKPVFPPVPPDAHWGPLRLLEKIGEGSYGEVYRAFDPALEMEVALKILRRPAEDEAAGGRFFEEARRLARVRDTHVLRVHGAAVHDGRVGIWTELIQGRTLEECIRADGPFGPREAAAIGIDLCAAIAAVHRAGLIHRDLKTGNVMRESGGRIVLMDFGSVSELLAPPVPREQGFGTPLTLAPEVLNGESATPATDVYGLGVLLYRLVTGRYPIEASTLVELIDRHCRGEWMSLREARPDLPHGFVDVVERAIDADPKRRYSGPGALERALKTSSHTGVVGVASAGSGSGDGPVAMSQPWLRPLLIGLAAGVVATGGALLARHFWPHGMTPLPGQDEPRAVAPGGAVTPAPAADLMATARLYRQRGGVTEPLSEGASVAPGDGLYLSIESGDPMYVYVLDEDEAGRVYGLFPLLGFTPGNPLPPGIRHRLPGRREGRLENWRITSAGGTEEVIVIGSRTRLVDLEGGLRSVPHAIPGAPVTYNQLSPRTLNRLRGIGGTDPAQEAPAVPPGATSGPLSRLLSGLEAGASHQQDLWVWHISLRNGP
jgi:hypothetical protein